MRHLVHARAQIRSVHARTPATDNTLTVVNNLITSVPFEQFRI